MRIHFDNVAPFKTGPGTFMQRLAVALWNSGHELVDSGPSADVSLVSIERTGAPLAKKVVQRLDGIWFKPEEFKTKNVRILELFGKADGIVFQSSFDHDMINHHWGRPGGTFHMSEIISNGINLDPVKELTIPALIQLRSQYKKMYVCSSNWHPQKRLSANVRLFQHLRSKEPNSCLLILGNNPDCRVADPHVFYAGSVGPEVYNEIYSAANWMFHLAWADHCPNVVVEALAQGTPVVCAAVGGTKELIGNYGIVLKEQPYNFELTDYDNPPDIDVTQVDELPDRSTLDYKSITDIDIRNVATKYVQLFERVLKQ